MPTLSVAVLSLIDGACQATTPVDSPDEVWPEKAVGHVRVGGWLSMIVTVKEHMAEFAAASEALHATLVDPH